MHIVMLSVMWELNVLPQFICCDVYGVFGCTFCDFGENFYVCDPTGEDPEEVFIGNVTKVKHMFLVAVCSVLHTGNVIKVK